MAVARLLVNARRQGLTWMEPESQGTRTASDPERHPRWRIRSTVDRIEEWLRLGPYQEAVPYQDLLPACLAPGEEVVATLQKMTLSVSGNQAFRREHGWTRWSRLDTATIVATDRQVVLFRTRLHRSELVRCFPLYSVRVSRFKRHTTTGESADDYRLFIQFPIQLKLSVSESQRPEVELFIRAVGGVQT
jgi:hypothetical protein